MTYDGPVRETVPEYEIECGRCGRLAHVRTGSPEMAEEWFSAHGWIIDRGTATCRTCAIAKWRDD